MKGGRHTAYGIPRRQRGQIYQVCMAVGMKKLHRPQGENETGLEAPVSAASWIVRQRAEGKSPEPELFKYAQRKRECPKTDQLYQRIGVWIAPEKITPGIISKGIFKIIPRQAREGRSRLDDGRTCPSDRCPHGRGRARWGILLRN